MIPIPTTQNTTQLLQAIANHLNENNITTTGSILTPTLLYIYHNNQELGTINTHHTPNTITCLKTGKAHQIHKLPIEDPELLNKITKLYQ